MRKDHIRKGQLKPACNLQLDFVNSFLTVFKNNKPKKSNFSTKHKKRLPF